MDYFSRGFICNRNNDENAVTLNNSAIYGNIFIVLFSKIQITGANC